MDQVHVDAPHDAQGFVTSVDGTRIAWFRDGAGPPLVLVHGTTADHSTWRASGPLLATSYTAYTIDRRGRGASGDGASYRIVREYEDVAAVADAIAGLHHATVDIVGHSFGGRVALGASRLTPGIRRVVVYEGAPAPPEHPYQPPDLVDRLASLVERGDSAEALRTFMREVVGMSSEDLAAFEAAAVWPLRVAAAPTIVRELIAEASPEAGLDALGLATIPVLQLLGGASLPVFRIATEALDRRLGNSRIAVLAGQKHAAHHAAPEAFVRAVRQFLES